MTKHDDGGSAMHEENRSCRSARSRRSPDPRATTGGRVVAGVAVVVLALVGVMVGLGPGAAAPLRAAEPVTAFLAPRCEGSTTVDPADPTQHSGLANLLSVTGPRLADYTAGRLVPLYDAAGRTEDAPLCGTRQIERPDGTTTAESQWMFCTSYVDDLCGDVDEDGQGTDSDGAAVGPMETATTHPTLSVEDQLLVGYLIENGHSYVGTGADYGFGGTARADAGTSTNTRQALQVLVWCITDLDAVPSADFRSTCQANLPPEEQARLLALITAEPSVELDFDDSGQTHDVGETVRFALTTTLVDQPITMTASPLGAFTVCSGDATLTGTTLTVAAPADASTATRIELCATPTVAGPVSVTVNAGLASVRQVSWNRSASVAQSRVCQVYAAFVDVPREARSSVASATFLALPTPEPSPTPTPTPSPTPIDPPATVTTPVLPRTPAPSLAADPIARATGAVLTTARVPALPTARTAAPDDLAHTGASTGAMILLAGAAGLTGSILVAVSRLRRRS